MAEYDLPHVSHDLSGQSALVTGASSGLGRRYARVLARAGARVAITGRRLEMLESLKAEIAQGGGIAEAIVLDMTNPNDIVAAVDKAQQKLGTLTILVNNAGVPDSNYATKLSGELIQRVFDTNLKGPFILSCEFARRLMGSGKPGRIVNISSAASFYYAGDGAALYSTTKAGLNRMTETLAVEWSRFNINVNAIAPGAFNSEMMDGMLERMGDIAAKMPRKRVFDAALLDSSLLFLCSPASEAVTGTIIRADDGQYPR